MENKIPKIRKDGSTYTVDFTKTIHGKRIHIYKKGFRNVKQAQNAIPILIRRHLAKINENAHMTGTFESFMRKYVAYRSRRVSPSTVLSIRSIQRTHMTEFSGMDIPTAFSIDNVLPWYDGIVSSKDLSPKFKNRILGEMRQIIAFAGKIKYIDIEAANDAIGIIENINSTRKKEEKAFYTKEQLAKFLAAVDDEKDKAQLTLFIYLGARISEFTGLTWGCFDEKGKSIEIKQQVIYLSKGKAILTTNLKTRESYRICRLSEPVYEMLMKMKRDDPTAYIFPRSARMPHRPLSKSALRAKLNRYMDKADLPHITPHGFRHSKATLLMSVCQSMADVKAAARFLGHSVTMMMETYAHEEKKNTEEIVARLQNIGF